MVVVENHDEALAKKPDWAESGKRFLLPATA